MLSRKHYTEIAKIINKNRTSVRNGFTRRIVDLDSQRGGASWGLPLNKFVEDLTEYFAEDNDKFDAERFRVACGVKQQEEIRG